jgi:hypothetical protein
MKKKQKMPNEYNSLPALLWAKLRMLLPPTIPAVAPPHPLPATHLLCGAAFWAHPYHREHGNDIRVKQKRKKKTVGYHFETLGQTILASTNLPPVVEKEKG